MATKYDTMGKEELRATCKAAGIAYGKMNNDGMRTALALKDNSQLAPVAKATKAKKEKVDASPSTIPTHPVVAEPAKQAEKVAEPVGTAATLLAGSGLEGSLKVAEPFLKATQEAFVNKAAGKTAGIKIEKDREEKNGVKRPSVGGQCRAVWDYLDANTQGQLIPTAKQVKEAASAHGWNVNNASIEYYQWRKFHGVRGRQ